MGRLVDKVRRIPAEVAKLPSMGVGYTPDMFTLGVVLSEVEVFPVSTYDEIILKTPELLLSGEGIYEVFRRKIPSIAKPEALFQKDVDYLLTFLRKVSYGDLMTVSYTHDCDNAKEHDYGIPLSHFLTNTKRIDPTKTKLYEIELDNGQQVIIGNSKFADVLELTQITIKFAQMGSSNNSMKDVKDIETAALRSIAVLIDSVDGVSDKEEIIEWLSELPVEMRNVIRSQINRVASGWGVDFSFVTKCKDCDKEIDLNPVINPVSFFTRL